MDSKNIFIVCGRKLRQVVWINKEGEESEYRYIGVGSLFETRTADEIIKANFKDGTIFLVVDRHESREISTLDAVNEVQRLTENHEIVLTNINFENFIHFNRVGTYRIGFYRKGVRDV
ncbi:hypothetical protein [Oligoflexus tunisiensis]|uniref:hypothetical protein n=1 Tax=Oligoflexus tunisiensis TaxID=708132 RepID=UPI00114D22AA|nr:hypothetical protein [Oligoflexus tunisiensis]